MSKQKENNTAVKATYSKIICGAYIVFQIFRTADIQKCIYLYLSKPFLPDNDTNETKPVIVPVILTTKNGVRLASERW